MFKASTVYFPNTAAFRARDWTSKENYIYGLHGTPTTFELEARVASLEGAQHCLLSPSGLSAIVIIYMALLNAGDELLVPSNVYAANRTFVTRELIPRGVQVKLYDPTRLDTLEFSSATKLVWIEAPCSITFEFPDVKAISELARQHGAFTAIDNTWGAGVAMQPLDLGVDISMQSLSKFASGSGDVVMGAIACNEKAIYDALKLCAMRMGLGASGGEAEAVLKGLDTLFLRYQSQDLAARELIDRLSSHSSQFSVLHPSLSTCDGHGLWKRDCTAAAGVFSLMFDGRFGEAAVDGFVDRLKHFRIGFGWGATTSLVLPLGRALPSVKPLTGELVRLSIGLEPVEALTADLKASLSLLEA